MAISLLFLVFALLLVIGVPVAFALAASALATLLYLGLPPVVLVQQLSAGTGSASLIRCRWCWSSRFPPAPARRR